jgi:DNA-binding SARP family transcriptional activator
MDQLTIRLFGGIEVQRGRTVVSGFPTQRSTRLFAYLVMNRGRLHHREVLCGRFWGEQTDVAAKKGLRNALWRIRSVIEPNEEERGTLLQVEGSHVGFRASANVWVDAWEFERGIALLDTKPADGGAMDPDMVDRMGKAASLYRGDLLAGHYDEWCLTEQERLRLAYLTLLERLVGCHRAAGQWLEAITIGRQLLRLDPFREHIHRAVMDCHLAMGDRPSALRQYGTCAEMLRRELSIEPMEETRALYESMLQGESPRYRTGAWPGGHRRSRGSECLVTEVDDALRTLYRVTERLERARLALVREDRGRGKAS